MSFLTLIVVLALIGVLTWAITKLPMPSEVRTVIIVVAVIVAILYALNAFGLFTSIGNLRVPQVK